MPRDPASRKVRNLTFASARALRKIERILTALKDGMLSAGDLAAKLHADHSGVTDYLAHLMREPRRVRIAGYSIVRHPNGGGSRQPLYGLGSEPDAPSAPATNAERWQRVKADPARLEQATRRNRERNRRLRDAVPPEQRQRRRLCKDEALEPRILELLNEAPGYSQAQFAARFQVSERSVRTAICKLRATGAIRRAANATSKEHRYETPDNPLPRPLAAGQHKHGPFAALGI